MIIKYPRLKIRNCVLAVCNRLMQLQRRDINASRVIGSGTFLAENRTLIAVFFAVRKWSIFFVSPRNSQLILTASVIKLIDMPCHLSAYTACATRTGAFSISELPVNCTIFYPTNYRASNVNLELTARAPEAIIKYPRNAPSLFRRFSRRPHELIKSLSTVSNRPESSRNDHSVP